MTDPAAPPPERPEVVHQTTINTSPARSGGGSWMAFLVGGLIVVVAIIGFVVWSHGGSAPAADARDVNIDVNLPSPKMPDLPSPPHIEPPTVPQPNPGPTT